MVVSSVGPAVRAGVEILARGGNAVDAAVATAFAAGVAHQFSSGIGGGGFIVLRDAASGEVFAIDAREMAPAAAHSEMYIGADGKPDRSRSRVGGLAVGVPGVVPGLEQVHARFGRLSWPEVVAPAIAMCRDGVEVWPHHQRILRMVAGRWEPDEFQETLRIQLDRGQAPPLGWKLVQPDLAATLQAISARGSRALTEGPIAESIVKAANEAGGALSLDDLASYRVVWREPVRGTYRDVEIVSMPPPSSGGVLLVQMLNTLESFDVASLGAGSSQMIHMVSETMKLAFADRAVHLGDSDFYPVPIERLTSKAYGHTLAARLQPRPFWRRAPWNWGRSRVLDVEQPVPAPPDDAGTTHISVLDAEGNAVAITQSVNGIFGARITVPGTGIVLNNEMDDFASAPNVPNYWGAVGLEANVVAPRKRPLSSMTPTLVLKDGEPYLVTGSPMGPIIISTVLLTILNVVDFDMSIQEAVSSPRFHHQWRPDTLRLEPDHPRDVVEALREMGHPISERRGYLGASASILRDPETGLLWGSADPRRDSAAAGY